jgi:hypothetical protein
MSDPTIPNSMVLAIDMESSPGTIARAMKPAMSPMMSSPTIVPGMCPSSVKGPPTVPVQRFHSQSLFLGLAQRHYFLIRIALR